jgi:hypothetical protein
MIDIDNGGPAFPCDAEWRDGQEVWPQSAGMTLRDWFAGQALVGFSANPDLSGWPFERAAEAAWEQADAMIAARKGMPNE